MKKIIKIAALALVGLLIAFVLAVTLFLDHIIKKGVETVGPKVTQVSVKLDSVSLSVLSGAGSIKGLEVGNPEGYQSPTSIKLGSASLAIVPGSLTRDKIVIKYIRVEAPEITIEGTPKNNNLTKILENVQGSGGSTTTTTNEAPAQGESKKLQVDEFLLTGAKVNYTVAGQTVILEVPEIKLTGLGAGPDGITGQELTELALSRLMDELVPLLIDQSGKLGKKAVEDAASGAVDKAAKGITDMFKKQ